MVRRLVVSLAVVASLSFAPPAQAGGPGPGENDVRLPGTGSVTTPGVFDPWTEATIRQRYGFAYNPWLLQRFSEASNWVLWRPLSAAFDDFDDAAAKRIADGCKAAYPNDYMLQTRCAAEAVNLTLQAQNYGPGGTGPGLRSYCRDHARAMQEVFWELGIPDSSIGTTPLEGHVVNTVSFRGTDGVYYEYVLDAGWDPGKVWPYNDAARNWHDTNGDGRTDRTTMPPLGPANLPVLPPTTSTTVGSNVGRYDMTRPVATGLVIGAGAAVGGGAAR